MEKIIYTSKFTFDIFNIILYADDNNLLAIKLSEDSPLNFNGTIIDEKNSIIEMAETELLEYFNGKRKTFDIPIKNMSKGFEKKVYDELLTVDYGEVITYKGLGEKVGVEKSARAVGNAMAKNIFPIIIPCHRVVRTDGSIGNYTGGTDLKIKLLEFEKKHRD